MLYGYRNYYAWIVQVGTKWVIDGVSNRFTGDKITALPSAAFPSEEAAVHKVRSAVDQVLAGPAWQRA